MQAIAPAPTTRNHQQPDMNADNDLRAQLAAVINTSQHPSQHPHQQQQHLLQHQHLQHQLPLQHPQHRAQHSPQQHGSNVHQHSHGYGDVPPSSSASPQHLPNLDPAIATHHDSMMGDESGGDESNADGRKGGKRELSQSKRAAQNRAAQRAFRQRKEGYIKKLEEQVRELHALEDNYKAIQTENYSLREYIIHLQSRLIETHGDIPQPPPNVNLNHPRDSLDHHRSSRPDINVLPPPQPSLPHHLQAISQQLQASAAQAVAAGIVDNNSKRPHDDVSKSRFKMDASEAAEQREELGRQLQGSAADGMSSLPSM